MAVADQFAAEQQHGDLVPIAHARRGILVHIEHVDRNPRRRRQRPQRHEHFLAQAAILPRVQQKPQCGGSGPLEDFTECAMNSTVCAGTSPTAVT